MPLKSALIGYSGYVGGALRRLGTFDECFNSSNIRDIGRREYDWVVCAAPSSLKWRANKFPTADLEHVKALIHSLDAVRTERFTVISTVDVYPIPVGVDEDSPIEVDAAQPYGRHRFYLEEAVRQRFDRVSVIRLPQLFGHGLKKNFVYDLIHDHTLHLTHYRSVFQFYDLERLWTDLGHVQAQSVDLINFAVAPVDAATVARDVFGTTFTNETDSPPVRYDIRSVRLGRLGYTEPYLMGQQECLERMRRFVRECGERGTR